MDRLTREKSNYIEELVEFTRADLGAMKTPMERRAAVERWGFLFGGFAGGIAFMSLQGDEEPGSRETLDAELWERVLSLQAEWRDALEWLADRLDRPYQLRFSVNMTFGWAPGGVFSFGSSDNISDRIVVQADDIGGIEKRTRSQINEKVDDPLGLEPEEKTFPGGAQRFFESLSWFPTTALRRCQKCRGVFFHPWKRERKYCSSRCQKIASVQRAQAKKKKGRA